MAETHGESQRWRRALLDSALRVFSLVACVTATGVYLLPIRAPWLLAGLFAVALGSVLASERRSLGYRVRALCLLIGLHTLFALPLLRAALAVPNVSAGFLLEAVLAALLFRRRAGLIVAGSVLLTFAVTYWMHRAGVPDARPLDWSRGFDTTHWDVALRVALVAGGGSLAAVLGISHLVSRIERALGERDASLHQLEVEHAAHVRVLRELEQREADFHRARELEVLGRLAAFVAHDFNNALHAIFGGAELARRAATARDRDDALAIVLSAAEQAASTVRQLQVFGPQPKREPGPLDPLAAVRRAERLLRTLLPKSVELTVTVQPTAAITVDEGLLQSALMNLSLNARDAMRDGGRLEIRVRPACSYQRQGSAADVLIEVQDSGVGMDEPTLARVLAPYFTTKGVQGSGLGLASVRQTVEAAGGTISVRSAPGDGTCVQLRWPAAARPARLATRPSTPSVPPSRDSRPTARASDVGEA